MVSGNLDYVLKFKYIFGNVYCTSTPERTTLVEERVHVYGTSRKTISRLSLFNTRTLWDLFDS